MTYFRDCPRCGKGEREWLSTTNEWEGYCPECDIRFNRDGDILPTDKVTA